MAIKSYSLPSFYIDSLPDIAGAGCRELLRSIEINADPPEIFSWLKQLRIAPYSYDFIDNRGRKSPGYIIEDLPELQINSHFLLAFHIIGFKENTYIAGHFCEPVNPPVNRYMKSLLIEYRIDQQESKTRLSCKIKGNINNDISSKGFFFIFSIVNKLMMARQLRNIRRLSELLHSGKIETGRFDLKDYHPVKGIHWWVFCRRQNCKGLLTETGSNSTIKY